MEQRQFGYTKDGREATCYTIGNHEGMKVLVTDYGATLVSIFVPDRRGNLTDVILGCEDVAAYEKQSCYFGAVVGRNCNRISGAKFAIDGVEYSLEPNDRGNNLHSGSEGLSGRFWTVKEHQENRITLEITDEDRRQGFPGNATIQVTYEVTEENALVISYAAASDQKTVFNFTNHSYFNLNGAGNGTILDHTLQIRASYFTPTDEKAIPTGELRPVEGTPFDFRREKRIGADIEAEDEQLGYGSGYDHNFALDKETSGLELVATAYSSTSGIRMKVSTDCIGMQLYSANFIGGQPGKNGVVYQNCGAFCLETQYFPNAINEPNFATTLTEEGETYESKTIYTFSVENA
jgi:aldose 1-epimerase